MQNELKPEEIEQLKVSGAGGCRLWPEGKRQSPLGFIFVALSQLCMSKRYDGSQRALDLKSLRVDPGERCSPPQGCEGQEGAAVGDISPPVSVPPYSQIWCHRASTWC